MKARIDLHSHTRGSDGQGTAAEIAASAKAAGLDGLALTDHHTNMTDEVHRVADALRAVGVLPIIGVEYSTAQGHLLVFGLDVPRMAWGMYPDMQDIVDLVNGYGGACVTPHPFKGYTKSLQGRVETIRGLAAVESLNGQLELSSPKTNRLARASAKRMGVPRTGASDAHFPRDIGVSFTEFDGPVSSIDDLIAGLKSGKFRAMRNEDLFAKRTKEKHQLAASQRMESSFMSVPPAPDRGWAPRETVFYADDMPLFAHAKRRDTRKSAPPAPRGYDEDTWADLDVREQEYLASLAMEDPDGRDD